MVMCLGQGADLHMAQLMPLPLTISFYRPDALPAAQPTASKHWRQFQITDIQR